MHLCRISDDRFKTIERFGIDCYLRPMLRIVTDGKHMVFFQIEQLFMIDRQGSVI